ncbi:fumarylacetoacetase [Silvibacterium bohemicum]|uniref:fumarylacetoacetase n=1 Tax=Silvibacterium bohemicum TaxID=1577686 RepID=A0A841JUU2_9BACT|nr:fumarylacetoacetase [Silvibacterium bohemicum]MBB6143519.1 fumarylacetoacetase [Silvibacterium bohemicum]
MQSWIESANAPLTDFPLENLPFGVFRTGKSSDARIGVAIGDTLLDLFAADESHLLDGLAKETVAACRRDSLNHLMSLGRKASSSLRARLMDLLSDPGAKQKVEPLLQKQVDIEMQLPAHIGDYTDFYASIYHATNVGRLFRPDNPLLPSYKYVPIGYHGRASSIVVSGADIHRPSGQTKTAEADTPHFAPTQALDYELEVGFFIGGGNAHGCSIPIDEAEAHIFGFCLVNDWSARDIQAWEYQPLGPFLAKSFATSISPWVVTMDALAPFRAPAFRRAEGDPAPLPYLNSSVDQTSGGFDVKLEVWLRTERMRRENTEAVRLSQSNLQDLYWTPAQMLAHHTGNGCNMRSGDLLASGTVSGSTDDSRGSLLEITRRGAELLQLPNGEARSFLEDGDEVTLRGYCEREGQARIGFGSCSGTIRAATPSCENVESLSKQRIGGEATP